MRFACSCSCRRLGQSLGLGAPSRAYLKIDLLVPALGASGVRFRDLVSAWSFSVRSCFWCPLGLLVSARSFAVRLVFQCPLSLLVPAVSAWSFTVCSGFRWPVGLLASARTLWSSALGLWWSLCVLFLPMAAVSCHAAMSTRQPLGEPKAPASCLSTHMYIYIYIYIHFFIFLSLLSLFQFAGR